MSTDIAQPDPQPVEIEEMDMGALLDSEAAQPSHLRRGEIVEGMVMGASPDGLIVDVGTKTEAVIPQSEMLSLGVDGAAKLKAGDTVKVMVLQPSSAEGHAIVSLDRARGEEGWDVLAARHESGEIFDAQVTGHNRGGILVNVDGVNAFVPLSQVDSVRRDDPDAANALASLVGKSVRLKVIELNRKRNRVILSERAAMAEVRKEQKDKILDTLEEGSIRTGHVSSITDFGVFVDLGGADGLAHMTELTWERGKKAKDLYNVGDEVQAYILKVDHETKKISLSLKRAQPEKWDSTVDRFVIGQILIGRVTKLMAFGAFVRLDGPVEGLIHISELSNRRIQHPKDVVKEGDVVPVKLVRIEKDRHRLGLSLRQARSDAEAMGFVFSHDGAVIDYPEDVREQFGLPARDAAAVAASAARPEPRTAQEAIERAVERDPEPVSAFAHAFAQALENAEPGTAFTESETAEAGSEANAGAGEATTAAPVVEDEMHTESNAVAESTEPATEPAEAKADANTGAEASEAVGQAAPTGAAGEGEEKSPEANAVVSAGEDANAGGT
ncbi:MAG TPA: S1 RNA-binding domain-containing protein [Tepidiformaceae bacterium]|nr:S1 RNA-binding domain-containing protein [Tepidiformaceae bacterium]